MSVPYSKQQDDHLGHQNPPPYGFVAPGSGVSPPPPPYGQLYPPMMGVPIRNVTGDNPPMTYSVNYSGGSQRDGESPESQEPFGSSFGDKKIRAAFVRKVYSILMLQLLVTVGFIALFMFETRVRAFVQGSMGMYWSAYGIFLVTYFTLVCCPSVRRKWPTNLIMLCIFTLAMSYMTATISSFHDTDIVLITMGITAGVCLGITLFATQTKWDVTGYGIYLAVILFVVFLFGIIAIIVSIYTKDKIMMTVYSGLIALVFSMYLMYDTQQIVGGRKVEMSPEEHIYGALQLYLDVVYIFLALLNIVGRK